MLILFLDGKEFLRLCALEDGQVDEVFEPGLEIAVQKSVPQDAQVLLPVHVHVLFKNDLVLGKCPRLVGAQDVHLPKGLDGRQALDDDVVPRHGERAARERGGHDDRQHLGREPHGHGHGEQEGIAPIALDKAVDEKDDGHHHERKAE